MGNLNCRIAACTCSAYSLSIHSRVASFGTDTMTILPCDSRKLVLTSQLWKASELTWPDRFCLIRSQGFICRLCPDCQAALGAHTFPTSFPHCGNVSPTLH